MFWVPFFLVTHCGKTRFFVQKYLDQNWARVLIEFLNFFKVELEIVCLKLEMGSYHSVMSVMLKSIKINRTSPCFPMKIRAFFK